MLTNEQQGSLCTSMYCGTNGIQNIDHIAWIDHRTIFKIIRLTANSLLDSGRFMSEEILSLCTVTLSFMHQPPGNHHEKEYHSRIRKVLAYIQENLSEDLFLGKLSAIACFSPFHFQKIFSLYVGESPKQYIMRLRLERIAHYLAIYPSLSINDAAFQCRFSSPSTFIRAFRKYYGTTPAGFRKLSLEEISKIGTLKPHKGKYSDHHSAEFWSLNQINEEVEGLTTGLNIEVKTIRSLNVAFIDSHLGDEDAITNTFKALTRWAEPRDLITPETRFIGIFLDMPFFTEYAKCRFRACISLPDGITLPKDIGSETIPGGKYASYPVKGTIRGVFKSLKAFSHGCLEQSGYQIAEITGFELYTRNPALKPYESIPRQIFIPVKPA
jgi:AraC family transcriptional regulator